MISVRENTFETNSSSTHSLTLASGKEYEAWEKGESLFGYSSEQFYNKENLYETCVDALKADFDYRKKSYEEKEEKEEKIDSWATKHYKVDEYALNHLPTKEEFNDFIKELQEENSGNIHTSDLENYSWDNILEHPEKITAKDIFAEMLNAVEDCALLTEDGYYNYGDYETFQEEREIDGVKVVAFGYYGYN